MARRVLYLVGSAPRVGKSALAQLLLEADGIPWLPTDVIRTVLRHVLPELDATDQDRSTPRGADLAVQALAPVEAADAKFFQPTPDTAALLAMLHPLATATADLTAQGTSASVALCSGHQSDCTPVPPFGAAD